MAQLVARLTGSQKVRDSNSLVSTNDGLLLGRNKKERTVYVFFVFDCSLAHIDISLK